MNWMDDKKKLKKKRKEKRPIEGDRKEKLQKHTNGERKLNSHSSKNDFTIYLGRTVSATYASREKDNNGT